MNTSNDLITVLVVDDERDIREGCQRILTRRGFKVLLAENGQAGLDILKTKPVVLVLLDIKMPGMDGLEVLGRIQEDYPDILVIIITGFATVETAIKAMKLGAYDFIPKPFQPDQLRIVVDRAVERRKLIDETNRLMAERQRTLIDLDMEKSRTRTIIRTLPQGVAVTTPQGQVVLMNPAFERLIGLDPKSGPGERLSTYIQDQGLCELVRKVGSGAKGGPEETHAYELTLGDERFFLAQCNQILGEEGACLGAVLVLTDVTEWKTLDRLRTDFMAKVSHELRSPLSTIDLQLGLLLGEGGGPGQDKQERLLTRAKERTKGLIFLIRDLLDISRIELNAGRQAQTLLGLEDILRQVVESLTPQAASRKQSLSLELSEDPLPLVMADLASLESVFTNLVANAVNYTPEGGWIKVRAFGQDGSLVVEVSDNGFGIAPEQQKSVFEKFYRVKNEKTRYIVGTGLGLSIVKAVVEGLDGQITLESEVDKGSTFTILLPPGSDSSQ